jgi:hypothetical protein
MPQFPRGYVHTPGPVAERYHCFSIRCHVEREQDKACYWPRLSRIHDLIEPFIRGWADVRLHSDQALRRRVGATVGPDGSFRVTLRDAPTGGWQKLTRDRLEMVATRYLSNNAHLIDQFEHGGDLDIRLFPPGGPALPHFFCHEIIGSRTRLKGDGSQLFQFLPHDFRLQIGSHSHHAVSQADPINQVLALYVWQGIAAREDVVALVRELGAITDAVHIWHAESGFQGEEYVDAEGRSTLRYSVFDTVEDAVDGRNRFGATWVDLMPRDTAQKRVTTMS